jgi:hypothetical protein
MEGMESMEERQEGTFGLFSSSQTFVLCIPFVVQSFCTPQDVYEQD